MLAGALGCKVAGKELHQVRLGGTVCDLYGHSLLPQRVSAEAEVAHL